MKCALKDLQNRNIPGEFLYPGCVYCGISCKTKSDIMYVDPCGVRTPCGISRDENFFKFGMIGLIILFIFGFSYALTHPACDEKKPVATVQKWKE